jgi:hypothetical protein
MLQREAEWLGTEMAALPADRLFPLVNLGSSTAQFRERDQPWMHRSLFDRARREDIVHVDLKADDGVDVVGSLEDDAVFAELRRRAPRSVLSSNLLEHLEPARRALCCARMMELVAPGGYLIVSVPRAFPYHPDPIDTGFRPGVGELAGLFPALTLVNGAEVEAGRIWALLPGNVRRLAVKSVGMALGRGDAHHASVAERAGAPSRLRDWLVPWAWRPFRVTCLVLERP